MKGKFYIEKRVAEDGKPYAVIMSVNGQVIFTSETYESTQNMNETINSLNSWIRDNGPFNVFNYT